MNNPISSRFLCCLATAVVLLGLQQAARAQLYDAIDLGTLGGTNSEAYGINDSGSVVGYSYLAGDSTYHAFVDNGTTMTDLGSLGGDSEARGISNSGLIVGGTYLPGNMVLTGNTGGQAFVSNGTTMQSIGTPGGSSSFAIAVSGSGLVAGYGELAGNTVSTAFLYNGTTMTDIGGNNSGAHGVNNSGLVVGTVSPSATVEHAASFKGTTITDLGTLGGTNSEALAVNDNGMIVGDSYLADNSHYDAFVDNGTTMTNLGSLGGGHAKAFGINDSNVIVGRSDLAGNPDYHAFVDDGTGLVDLNSLTNLSGTDFSYLSVALGINDLGDIVGFGVTDTGADHAFLLEPSSIPESSTYALFAGLGAMALVAWRRRTNLRLQLTAARRQRLLSVV
jgi:probable HAF family extracellular repeat protein